MATTNVLVVSGALLMAVAAPPGASAQTNLRERVAAAIESIQGACASDINKFCGNVTRGEGRVLLCMQAHEDQLSRRCQFSLYRASRHLERALDRVERIADACWSDIEAKCADSDGIGKCIMQMDASLSPACQTVVAGLRQGVESLASLRGMPVFGSDDKDVGKVVEVIRDTDGNVQSIKVEVGRFLGMGERVVTIDAKSFEQLADKVRLRISGDALGSLPDAGKPDAGKQ
jgi:sporulation protein YlmC with PRC-barrel domain